MSVLTPSLPLYIVIINTPSVTGRVFAERVSVLGERVYGVKGDLTDLWYRDLDPIWKQSPVQTPAVFRSHPYQARRDRPRIAVDGRIRA